MAHPEQATSKVRKAKAIIAEQVGWSTAIDQEFPDIEKSVPLRPHTFSIFS
jgi:hypothetical protein